MIERKPIAAGSFYPQDPEELRDYIRELFLCKRGPGFLPDCNGFERSVGLIAPHAGYIYSGAVSAHSYAEASRYGCPDLVVLIGPNHTGLGGAISVWPMGSWITPLGRVRIDEDAANSLIEVLPQAEADVEAHTLEHSLEVHLPFLQFTIGTGFKILPVCLGDQRRETAFRLSKALQEILKSRRFWIVASTDLNHYENHENTLMKDREVIEAIRKKDVENLYEVIEKHSISMCGYGPVATVLEMGFNEVKILAHSTSGDVSGDYSNEVGYLAACLY